jgi:hypothetical protein
MIPVVAESNPPRSATTRTRTALLVRRTTMRRPMTLDVVKKGLVPAVCATALTALIALQPAGAVVHAAPQLWSIVVHFRYADGFEFDYVLDTGVPTSRLGTALAECGGSHSTGSVVRYHCYPIPE